MTTTNCTHKGCERNFTKPSAVRAKQALQMHVDRVHTRRIVIPSGPRNHKHRDHHKLAATVAPTNGNGNGHAHSHKKKVKVSHKKFTGISVAEAPTNEFKFNFCPGCGGNIKEIAEGVVLARALKNNPKLLQQVLSQIKA